MSLDIDAVHRLPQFAPPTPPADPIVRVDVIGYHADGSVAGLRSFTLEEMALIGTAILLEETLRK